MPVSCVVGGCTRTFWRNPEVFWLGFPRNAATRREWVRFVNNTRADFTLTEYSKICSAHFSGDCVDESVRLKRSLGLKANYGRNDSRFCTLKTDTDKSKEICCTTQRYVVETFISVNLKSCHNFTAQNLIYTPSWILCDLFFHFNIIQNRYSSSTSYKTFKRATVWAYRCTKATCCGDWEEGGASCRNTVK